MDQHLVTHAESAQTDAFTKAEERLNNQRPAPKRLQPVVALVKSQNLEEAKQQLDARLAKNPNDADAISLLARVMTLMVRRIEAIALLQRCVAVAPDFDAARFNYADALFKTNRYEAALAELDVLLATDSENPLYRQLRADVFANIGENAQALAIYEMLAAENPTRAESWISTGHAARALGHQDKSVSSYRKAIQCRPSLGQAWWALANMKTVRFDGAEMALMQEQLRRTDLPLNDRVTIQFALAKAYEDEREFEKSFEHYSRANALHRPRFNYNPDALTSAVAAAKALFTPELVARHKDSGCKSPDPIFILGRPRSGSTLIEQILASHSAIEGTAELSYIMSLAGRLEGRQAPIPHGSAYFKTLTTLASEALTAMGEDFMRDTRVHRKLGRPFFIDKKPSNFAHIGLIHLILPNAKIIDARRHPCGTGLSMFKSFSTRSNQRLSELGLFYRDYLELMAHYDKVLPGRIHRVIYEDMVADTEGETRRLLDYLGLPFEENCLQFYKTERSVMTPSSEQVRRPITGEAVDYWRNFEPWLGPLIKSLGAAFTEYPNVPEELR